MVNLEVVDNISENINDVLADNFYHYFIKYD